MRILLLPNSFKGSLSARQTARVLCAALQSKHTLRACALSDGGDGFIDFFSAIYPQAKKVFVTAQNAFGKPTRTHYLWLAKQKTAVLETAQICGLGKAKKAELDPLYATSFGVGQVILRALEKGAKKIYIGLGGVACNDGGAGLTAALGARFLNKQNHLLARGAKPLLQLAQLDVSVLKKTLRGVQIYAIADVTNPLLGPKGSARVFGPQKGATPAQVQILEKSMRRWARVLKNATGQDFSHTPCTGAAGAMAAGLAGCLGAQFLLGADFLIQKAALEKQFKWADLIITSEGKLDGQTFYGKAPGTVLKLAQKYKKPVLFICGVADWNALTKQKLPQVCIAQLVDFAPSVEKAQKHAGRYVARVCKNTIS